MKLPQNVKIKHTKDYDLDGLIVCLPVSEPLLLPDNIIGVCSKCERKVQFRPDANLSLKKMCMSCFVKIASDDNNEIMVCIPEEQRNKLRELGVTVPQETEK